MKNLLFFAAMIISVNTFSQTAPVLSSSNSEGENKMEIFLSITHNDDAVSSSVRTTLSSMGGANTVAYCDKHSVFMVLADKDIYPNEKEFLERVKKLNPNAGLLSLKAGSISSFSKDCEPSNANDASRLKNLNH